MALPIGQTSQDRRSSSYKKNADRQAKKREEAAAKKAEEQAKSSVSIRPENLIRSTGGSGGGQVAIQGSLAQANYIETTVSSPSVKSTSNVPSAVQKRPTTVTRVAGFVPAGNVNQNIGGRRFKTYIPPGVVVQQYPRLTPYQESQRQLRLQGTFSDTGIAYGRNLVTSGFRGIQSENKAPPNLLNLYKDTGKIGAGGLIAVTAAASKTLGIERGAKFLLSKPDKNFDVFQEGKESYGEFLSRGETRKGDFEAGAHLLILGGTLSGAKATPAGSSTFVGAGKNVAKIIEVERQPTIASTVIETRGVVQRSFLGVPLKDKPVSMISRQPFVELTRDTGFLGGVSKEPILSSKGSGLFDLTVGRKTSTFELTTQGGSVGGVGQRLASTQRVNKRGQRVFGSTDTSVESFIVKSKGDVLFGGSVRPESVNFFGSRNVLERQGTSQKRFMYEFVDPVTGLDYVGNNFKGKAFKSAKDIPFNLKILEGGSVGQDVLPPSALRTRRGAIDLLKRESSGKTKVGDVDFFKTSEGNSITGNTIISRGKSDEPFLNFDQLIKNTVETTSTPKTRAVPQVKFFETETKRTDSSVSVLRLNDQKNVKPESKYSQVFYPVQTSRQKSKGLNDLSFGSLSSEALRSGSKLNSRSLFNTQSKGDTFNLSKLGLESLNVQSQGTRQRSLLDQAQVQRTRQVTRQNQSFFNIPPFAGETFFAAAPVRSKKKFKDDDFFFSAKPNVKLSGRTGVYALGDLRSVFVTEARTGREATAPLLRGEARRNAFAAFRGFGTGYIPTREIQLGKVKLYG